MPGVSVVMPVHNGAGYLRAAIESALDQTVPPLEIWVVDDASTDATPEILAAFGDRIRVLRNQTAGGPARARNQAVAQARGDLIAFLDADDLWKPAKLARQLERARLHPDFGILATDVESFSEEMPVVRRTLREMYPVRDGWVVEDLLFSNWITTSAALVPRAVFLDVGGFDETPCKLGEDWALWMRIAARHPVYFVDEVLTRRRIHPLSLGHSDPEITFRDLMRHLDAMERNIPQLQARPELVRRARYRICLGRGIQDLHHGRLHAARSKFRQAGRLQQRAWRARLWQALTYVPPRWLQSAKRWRKRWSIAA